MASQFRAWHGKLGTQEMTRRQRLRTLRCEALEDRRLLSATVERSALSDGPVAIYSATGTDVNPTVELRNAEFVSQTDLDGDTYMRGASLKMTFQINASDGNPLGAYEKIYVSTGGGYTLLTQTALHIVQPGAQGTDTYLTIAPSQLGAQDQTDYSFKIDVYQYGTGNLDYSLTIDGRFEDRNHDVRDTGPNTVLVYMAADNAMEGALLNDYVEMISLANPDANIVVQLDRGGGSALYGGWTTAYRFLVSANTDPIPDNSLLDPDAPNFVYNTEVNMGSATTLQNFITWGRDAFPAVNEILDIRGPGDGWRNGMAYDAASGDWLSMADFHSAIGGATNGGANPLDVILIDSGANSGTPAGLAGIEVAYEVKDYATYFLASADRNNSLGMKYRDLFDWQYLYNGVTPRDWAISAVDSFVGQYAGASTAYESITLLDLREVQNITTGMNTLSAALLNDLANSRSVLSSALSASRRYAYGTSNNRYVDLGDFLYNILNRTANTDVYTAASNVRDMLLSSSVIIDHWANPSGFGGTNNNAREFWIYHPSSYSDSDLRNDYNATNLSYLQSGDPLWDNVLLSELTAMPTISSQLSDSPDPSWSAGGPNSIVTLTATATDSDGTVTKVQFYRETNGTTGLQIADDTLVSEDTTGFNGWTSTFSVQGWATGTTYTYYAYAIDDQGVGSAQGSGTLFTTTNTVNIGARLEITDDSGPTTDRNVNIVNPWFGAYSPTASFQLSNTGDTLGIISNIVLQGTNSSDFVLTLFNNTGGPVANNPVGSTSWLGNYTIPPSSTYTLKVQFLPPAPAVDHTAVVMFDSTMPAAVSNTLTLHGTWSPTSALNFDFGLSNSPVAPGYTQVVPTKTYGAGDGFGWSTGTISALDRSVSDPLTTDFAVTTDGTFQVDVPNGNYRLTVLVGDPTQARDQMQLSLDGTVIDTLSTAAGEVLTRSYQISVTTGHFALNLKDLGGSDPSAVLNALRVQQDFAATYDFGTTSSPLAAGAFRVADTKTYNPLLPIAGSDYGWAPNGSVAPTIVATDTGIGPALTEDNHLLTYGTFYMEVPNGNYSVTVGLGDASGKAHNNIRVYVQGTYADLVSTTVAVPLVQKTYSTVVTDGRLRVGFDDFDANGSTSAPADVCVTHISLQKSTDLQFDFGTSSSPVMAQYIGVNNATTYNLTQGYGWTQGTITSFNTGTGTAMQKDSNRTNDGTFVVDVPRGTYDVTVTMGEYRQVFSGIGVYLEGTQVDTVNIVPSGVPFSWLYNKTYTAVDVADGQLTLRLTGAGPYATISGLAIKQVSTYLPPPVGSGFAAALTFAADASGDTLTTADAQTALLAAIGRWELAGLPSSDVQVLRSVSVAVVDLGNSGLARLSGNTLYLDDDAAGMGWFVDATPAADEEFALQAGSGRLLAVDSAAVDRIDLLSVVAHELGSRLSLGGSAAEDLLSTNWFKSERRVPSRDDVDALFASLNG